MNVHKYYFISILLISHFLELNACGIAVHNEITYRSIESFEPKNWLESIYKSDLLDSPSYTQAGSFFPDWGYQCLGNNQQSEDAHWPTFIKTAINYVREIYPNDKFHSDNHVKGLISFIFAIMSHGMADVKWHSLDGLSNYFITAMAKLDFHDNESESHLAADAGAEFTLRHSNHLSYLNQTWHVPIKDIIEIYKRLYQKPGYNRRVPRASHIQYCMTAAFAASKIDLEFGQLMFGYYGSKSPFLVEELYDYYRGGIEDMLSSVIDCYPELIDAFENGIQYSIPDSICASYFYTINNKLQCLKTKKTALNYKGQFKDNIFQYYDSNTGVLTITMDPTTLLSKKQEDLLPQMVFQKKVITADMFNDYDHQQKRLFRFQQPLSSSRIKDNKCVSLKEGNEGLILTIPMVSARLGHQIATGDFDGNKELDMAISAPYYENFLGSVFILNSTITQNLQSLTTDQDIRDISKNKLNGNIRHGRFGWSMTTIDINQDGIDDLAISTPFNEGHRIDIYFGQKNIGLSDSPNLVIQLNQEATTLYAEDINQDGFKDLIIGCPLCSVGKQPQVGKVFILTSKKEYQISKYNNKIEPDFIIKNPDRNDKNSYQHFGESILLVKETLLIGSPNYSVDNKQRVGKIYAFDTLTKSLKWTMTGLSEFQQFGKVLATNRNNILAISSPSEEITTGLRKFWQGGSVRIYNWTRIDEIYNAKKEINRLPNLGMEDGMIGIVKGRSNAGHLGQSLHININSNDIWIGEPMSEQENGRIYKLSINEDTGDDHSIECIKNNEFLFARFGSQIDTFGFNHLCITSQRYNQNSHYSGAVILLQTSH